jgi:hypothetical protein
VTFFRAPSAYSTSTNTSAMGYRSSRDVPVVWDG